MVTKLELCLCRGDLFIGLRDGNYWWHECQLESKHHGRHQCWCGWTFDGIATISWTSDFQAAPDSRLGPPESP